ncbi:DNA cytosine methyltransferase [Mycobacterium malmoense]|uniref:DNA cytosine methyltransferase n=1 Tax=Mycobacterium malmoense TaxID=1780 RepID=UPI000AF14B40|nr:DNA cytosine methyltransferase [Mycobacterium malmoense]
MLTVTDLFCGAGGSSTGAIAVPGVTVRIASNHWDLAIRTHNTNHPDTDHLCADLSAVDPRRFPRTDLLWASPECFTAGHLVTTYEHGQVPIEDIEVGMLVLTHLGRFRPVTRVQSKPAPETVLVKGHGHTGIETTPSHSFWARESGRVWQNDIRQYRREYADAEWLPADELASREALWATPVSIEKDRGVPNYPALFGDDAELAAWVLGRWLGDGSLSFGRNAEVVISCSFNEETELRKWVDRTRHEWKADHKRTAVNFRIGDREARDWLAEHCGVGAGEKQVPTWALMLSAGERAELLAGYMSADGGTTQRRHRASTVSKKLAISMRLLAESIGHRVALAHDNRDSYTIEGRTGRARRQWIMHWEPKLAAKRSAEAFVDGIHAWSRVRSVEPARSDVTVYNIEVDEDHSYVLDGIVVKNCTNHSVARGRKRADAQPDLFGEVLPDAAAERSRATMWDVPRFAEVHRYEAVIVENVVEAWHWEPFRAWLLAMDSLGYDHHVVFLNSMHAQAFGPGAPQSRDRMYVVFWRKGNRRPEFERVTAPAAVCPTHGAVRARQVFKRADRAPWGRYRQQYIYTCPVARCHQIVEPHYRPAAEIIDWSLLGQRIGDRDRPLAEKTLARIRAGIEKHWAPFITEHVHEYRTRGLDKPLSTVTAGGHHFGLAVPVEGRSGKTAQPTNEALRTQTTRSETGLAFIAELRGGASKHRPVSDALCTVVASGNHHGLVTAYYGNGKTRTTDDALSTISTIEKHALLMRNNTARGDQAQMTTPATEYLRTVTTTGHQSLLTCEWPAIDIDDVLFRMLDPREIKGAMDFPREYKILGNRREQVRQAGNSVTPPCGRDTVGIVAESLGVMR